MLPFPSRSSNKTLIKLRIENKKDDKSTIDDISSTITSRKPSRMAMKKIFPIEDEVDRIYSALDTEGLVDLSIDRFERRKRRKKYSDRADHLRHVDPVYFVDLHIASDYNKYFSECIDLNISLNTKGPLANLWYSFQLVIEEKSQEGRQKVQIFKHLLFSIN
jgi:hypothetical protein